jgi:hypothetical protein
MSEIRLNDLSEEQMVELGFGLWNEETRLFLIPLWLFPFLPDDTQAESISGEHIAKKYKMDTDNRFGCLAYGVRPCESQIRMEIGAS